jgi:hypothetical protein
VLMLPATKPSELGAGPLSSTMQRYSRKLPPANPKVAPASSHWDLCSLTAEARTSEEAHNECVRGRRFLLKGVIVMRRNGCVHIADGVPGCGAADPALPPLLAEPPYLASVVSPHLLLTNGVTDGN